MMMMMNPCDKNDKSERGWLLPTNNFFFMILCVLLLCGCKLITDETRPALCKVLTMTASSSKMWQLF